MPKQGYLGAFYAKVLPEVIDNCDVNWTAGTHGAPELDTGDKKEGSASVKIVVASAVAGDILATHDFTAINLVNHKRVQFWIKSSVTTASGDLCLLIDETSACGASPPEEVIELPGLTLNTWTQITLPLAAPADLDAVISVGLEYNANPQDCNIWIDDINAVSSLLSHEDLAMTGAVAFDDPAETDETTEANSADANDMTLLPVAPAVGDAYYFGHSAIFDKLKLNIGTQGDGVWTITWKYWDGDSWEPLTNVLDGTDHFRAAAGNNEVTFVIPGDWALKTIQTINAYWISAEVTAYTSIVTQPKGTQSWIVGRYEAVGIGNGTEFDLDHPNVDLDSLVVKVDGVVVKDYEITVKGHITFVTAPANGLAITASYTYWVVAQAGGFRNWSFSLTGDTAERTDFSSTGWKTFVGILKGWTGSAEQFWLNEKWSDEIAEFVIVKFYEDVSGTLRYEGWARLTGVDVSTAVDTLIMSPITLQGTGVLSYESS